MEGLGLHTKSIWAGSDPEQWAQLDVMPPISATSIYKAIAPGKYKCYDYSRMGNPTRASLEKALAILDNAKYGFVYTSGSAAFVGIAHLLSMGDHIVCVDDLYSGTQTYFNKILPRQGITTTFVDGTVAENIIEAMKANTKMIWLESASNPLLKIVDIKKIVKLVKNKNPEAIIVVDNTFLTPCILRPLDLGADICMMSCSKYVNGHHDIIMGCITTNREDLQKELRLLQEMLGAVPGGMDCYQVIRSLKTLPLRMDRHHENGLAVAKFLSTQKNVVHLSHPLLPTHPQHALALEQHGGRHSGMIAFEMAGDAENVKKFAAALKVVLLAVSLGGTVSTVVPPGNMIISDMYDDASKEKGLKPTLLRLSVGLEDAKDIIADLEQALKKAYE